MQASEIIQKAQDIAQLQRFDNDSFRAGLDISCREACAHSLRTERGRAILEQRFVDDLVRRLKVADYARRHPEALRAEIRCPLFVMGMPRSGTTLVSGLLGSDRARRSLLRWEVAHPVPPPKTALLYENPHITAMKSADETARASGATMAHVHYE